MRAICWRAASPCCPSNSVAAAPASRRCARFMMAATSSRSRNSSAAVVEGFTSRRCALKNNSDSSRMRLRIAGEPWRQAAYNRPASRVSQ